MIEMGKRRRFNRFITKWIKSDLPDDRSTVLLLGVTRIPTSPAPARRPCSLPLVSNLTQPHANPNSLVTRKSIIRRNSSATSRKNPRLNSNAYNSTVVQKSLVEVNSSPQCSSKLSKEDTVQTVSGGPQRLISGELNRLLKENRALKTPSLEGCDSGSGSVTPCNSSSHDFTPAAGMDRSVDSIGACSLDFDVSANLSDLSEGSSVGTLRSVSLPTPSPEHRLPSYLSLACTVSGYSTTTNYDPERLSRSRDTSPHRLNDEQQNLTFRRPQLPTYSVRNNLLSPPNLVPLPTIVKNKKLSPNMAEQTITHHRQGFYTSSSKTVTYMSKESRGFSSFCTDSVDSCIQNNHANLVQNKHINYENRNVQVTLNGESSIMSETRFQEFANGTEQKSFIQQRVERLYGPGALAQGFFINKRQKNRSSESDHEKAASPSPDKHSKSLIEKATDISEFGMKQSTSSPTLPVLRHLRPEFRAQLPILNQKRGIEIVQKSNTVPSLKEELKLNGHHSVEEIAPVNGTNKTVLNSRIENSEGTCEKDGHYFLTILEKETKRLLDLAEKIEVDENTEGLSEEVKGKLRAASGKARLLASQKMQQFKGLCTNNITQSEGEAFPTTNQDLQGFWDMVLLQVDQVNTLFKEIDRLRENNWEEVVSDTVDNVKTNGTASKPRKVINRTRPAVNEEARKQRESQRKQMLEERRKAMRGHQQNLKENIEIFVPDCSS